MKTDPKFHLRVGRIKKEEPENWHNSMRDCTNDNLRVQVYIGIDAKITENTMPIMHLLWGKIENRRN